MIVLITISENNTIEIQLSVLTPKNSRSLIFVSEENCVQYYAFKCNKNLLKCAFEIPKSICLNDLIS